MSVVTIPLAWPRPPLTGNDRGHTRYSPFTRIKVEAQMAIRRVRPEPVAGANVSLHWRIPDRRRRDADNLGATLKAVLDALVAERVLPDDSWVHVPETRCVIHPPTDGVAAMWVELSEVTAFEVGA